MRQTPQRPKMGQRGWLPDEDAIRLAHFRSTTPGERVAEAISISRTATKIAAAVQQGAHQPVDAEAILSALVEHEVEFVVIGGLALAAHGLPRTTTGVEIVPAPDRGNVRRLDTALAELNCEVTEGGNWSLRTRAGRVDVMQWVPGIENGYPQLRPNAIEADVPGVGRVAFAGYDDLVTMKRTAGRPEDELDLLRLEGLREAD